MSTMGRNKGKRGEREVIKILQPIYDEIFGEGEFLLKRNTMQADKGGFDIEGIDDFAIEVKRQERLNLKAWWRQTVDQAGKYKFPVLFYRRNGEPWSVKYIKDGEEVITPLPVFLDLLRAFLKDKINIDNKKYSPNIGVVTTSPFMFLLNSFAVSPH